MPSPIINTIYQATPTGWVSPGRPSLSMGNVVTPTTPKARVNGVRATGAAVVAPTIIADFSDSNPPWAYNSTADFTADWPGGTTIVDIQTGGADFYTNLSNTVSAAGKRVVVRLQAGVYHLTAFNLIGSSGDPTYSFGFWFANLQGLVGQGADQTFVQMDANSMTTPQLNKMATFTAASFAPNQMGFARFDGSSSSSPVLLAGITFRAADQQNQTALASDVTAVVPQPASHNGIVIYPNNPTYATVSYCRFQAAGRAMTSAPPFETGNLITGHGVVSVHNCEFDGRRSSALDPKQPRRCGAIMLNGEIDHEMTDCWIHHSNVSRYAANDQNVSTAGVYKVTRVKSEQISNTQNVDPSLNGGVSLGGWTNACNFGWESSNAAMTIKDPFISVDNANLSGQFAAHLQLTSVGSRNPQGGRLIVNGGMFKHTAFAQLDGFLTLRIAKSTYWYMDGVANTISVISPTGATLTPYEFTGTWPPTQAQIFAASISPSTHFIYKGV